MSVAALPRSNGDETAVIGLGTAALGRPAYITTNHGTDLHGRTSIEQMLEAAVDVFDAAYANGVRYFDAARSYGRAEEFLAAWIQRRNPLDIFVASKWGYTYVGDWKIDADVQEVKDHHVEAYRRQVVESKNLLGDHLNLYQIHSVTPDSPTLDDATLLRELLELKLSGVHIGMSTSGPRQAEVLQRVAQLDVDGVRLFDAVQVTWNLLEQSTTEALTELHDAGITVIIKEALANGRLAPAGDRQITIEDASDPADVVALRVAIEQSFADVVLSGVINTTQLLSNLSAQSAEPATPRLEPIPGYAIDRDEYWEQRSRRAWT